MRPSGLNSQRPIQTRPRTRFLHGAAKRVQPFTKAPKVSFKTAQGHLARGNKAKRDPDGFRLQNKGGAKSGGAARGWRTVAEDADRAGEPGPVTGFYD